MRNEKAPLCPTYPNMLNLPQIPSHLLLACWLTLLLACQPRTQQTWSKADLLFEDNGTQDWQAKWMLDGQRSQVINSEAGMELIAGPEHGNDTCHTVLWTQASFSGNLCIEYDYTRTDTSTRCVNILYFHATGKGTNEYPRDIALWNDKRVVAHMRTYFNNMQAYHISYAAFAAKTYSGDNDYIRLRRYNPLQTGLKNTNIAGDHFKTGLFKPHQTYHIQVFKYEGQIEMHIQNKAVASDSLVCKWDVSSLPTYENGRIGLRHMYTRSARYQNFKVWSLH